ncbi:alpha/beta fold hydrolase [Sporosarcina oncorhynchi]|uniref:Alpha/beta fold hydrolase n=1 Tax=Sporosarcina oncorhynchi TaxID=3056444 RepID=A0ABZ0L3C0_9BACL|nr:alpha/beta fold hydrolase [Sporosarcina sp. T2O-4]WOV87097.1 alpha/beta fold hydrolase [Sporosarcina sp. T2O-4]
MKTGVLFIHGFTGGPFEVRPFMTYIQEQTDWVVSVPVLPGHEFPLDLKATSAESWLMEAELALKRLRKEVDRVLLVGFSMGGLIALYLTLRYPIEKIVLLSAAAKYISPRFLLEDAVIMLTESVTKTYPPNTFYHLYDYKLRHTPFHATREFLRLVKIVEPYYGKITVPVCVVQGKKDGIVPFATAEYLLKSLGSKKKQLIISEEGKHHICYSDDCQEWFGKVYEFMRED